MTTESSTNTCAYNH